MGGPRGQAALVCPITARPVTCARTLTLTSRPHYSEYGDRATQARAKIEKMDRLLGRSALRRRAWVMLPFGCALALLRPASAVSVDCAAPEDFCSGDPCKVTASLDVTTPSCVLDFGARALILDGAIRLPRNGLLSLSAGSIELRRKINGKHSRVADGEAASVSLAALGEVRLLAEIDVSGATRCGAITITAGGPLELRNRLRGRTRARGSAPGATVTIASSATVTVGPSAHIDAGGGPGGSGGQVTVTAEGDVILGGRIDASGRAGGSIVAISHEGTVSIENRVRARGTIDGGGTALLEAAADLRLLRRPAVLDVSGRGAPGGGTMHLHASRAIALRYLWARGGPGAPGGTITATAPAVELAELDVRGGSAGGRIEARSTADGASVTTVDARSDGGNAGQIAVDAAADAAIGDIAAGGAIRGGDIRIAAAGRIALGTATYSIDTSAPLGGAIAAHTPADIVVAGRLNATVGGCVGLSAGGTVDVSHAIINVPITASCP